MINPPKPVSGMSPMAAWCNQLLRFCIANRLRSGRNYNLIRSTDGVALDLPNQPGGAGKGGSSLEQYIFVSHPAAGDAHQDYISCTPANDPNGSPVWILKPDLLWFSIKTRTARKQTLTYSNWDGDAQSRLATNPVGSVTQFITPVYAPGDLIWAMSATFYPPAGAPSITTLVEVQSNRSFAAP